MSGQACHLCEVADAELEKLFECAHAEGGTENLAPLYEEAARRKAAAGDTDAQAFLLTQAYVYALDCGHEHTKDLRQALVRLGRETNGNA